MSSATFASNDGSLAIGAFGGHPNDSSDTTLAVRMALAQAESTGAQSLTFAPGRYDFWPDRAREKFYFISNNDPGLKRIAFPIDHLSHLTIDGQGARFVFHGYICPFILDHARNITLKNFSIDWQRPFESEARIVRITPDGPDLEFSAEFPYQISKGILTFIDREKIPNSYPAGRLLEFDAAKREPAFMASEWSAAPAFIAREIDPGRVHLTLPNFSGTPGDTLVFENAHRACPAMVISDSENTTLDHVTIYHAGGMGVLAQHSSNLTYDHLVITPPPSHLRMYSVTADATHFADCFGQITMTDSRFENQGDDGTNIHGIYVRVSARLSPTQIMVQLVHPQQAGLDCIVPGEHLELVRTSTLETFGVAQVRAVTRLNSEFSRVTVAAPLPAIVPGQDIAASLDSHPDVLIRHCYFGKNRARGIGLGSRGKIVIENNTFHTQGPAIIFGNAYKLWFEQDGVRDCTIQHNHFDNCAFGSAELPVILVGSIRSTPVANRFNRNILIENNTFDVFKPQILQAVGVDGLIFRDNQINPSRAYPPVSPEAKPFQISFSEQVKIQRQ